MLPAVHFPNNAAYVNAKLYSQAIADLFKPQTTSFNEIWLDGEKAKTEEYWQAPLIKEWGEGGIDKLMRHDNGRGIITGHEVTLTLTLALALALTLAPTLTLTLPLPPQSSRAS